jgi:hypothetical protein
MAAVPWRRLRVCLASTLAFTGSAVAVAVAPAAAAASAPAVSSVSPTSGPTAGGTRVAVYGSNFSAVRAVRFGTGFGAAIHVVSPTKLLVTAPAHAAGSVDIRVTTGYGMSAAHLADHFRYVAPPATVAISPAADSTSGGARVAVYGSNFSRVTAVRFGAASGTSLHPVSSTKLLITAPAHAAGPVDIRVTTAYGTSAAHASDRFTYVPAPVVTAVTPSSGSVVGNDLVTVTGTNFTAATAVRFDATAGMSVTVLSPTRLTVVSPWHGSGPVDVRVTTVGGTSPLVTADRYTFVQSWVPTSAPLPADAASYPQTQLNSVACPVAGSCTAVGYYTGTTAGGQTSSQAVIETLSGGAWSGARAPVTGDDASTPNESLASVACPTDGSCTAAGSYRDSADHNQALIVTLSGGIWAAARAPLPADAGSDPRAFIGRVVCPADGSCAALGQYDDSDGVQQDLVETLSDGVWTPLRAALPADANVVAHPTLSSVSCPSPTSCVVVGQYLDGANVRRPVIETLAGGLWVAAQAPLPPGASGDAHLTAVMCPVDGSCTAVGDFDAAGTTRPLIETLSGGSWGAAVAPLPDDNVDLAAGSLDSPGLYSVTCDAAASCTAAGGYPATDGHLHGLLERLSTGSWTAVRAPQPATVADLALRNVACPTADSCVATGAYFSSLHGGVIETFADGVWKSEVAPAATSTRTAAALWIGPLACPAIGACVIVGKYDESPGIERPLVVTQVP